MHLNGKSARMEKCKKYKVSPRRASIYFGSLGRAEAVVLSTGKLHLAILILSLWPQPGRVKPPWDLGRSADGVGMSQGVWQGEEEEELPVGKQRILFPQELDPRALLAEAAVI